MESRAGPSGIFCDATEVPAPIVANIRPSKRVYAGCVDHVECSTGKVMAVVRVLDTLDNKIAACKKRNSICMRRAQTAIDQ
jgi:hypothetical protein